MLSPQILTLSTHLFELLKLGGVCEVVVQQQAADLLQRVPARDK